MIEIHEVSHNVPHLMQEYGLQSYDAVHAATLRASGLTDFPEGGYVTVVQAHVTIGGELTYYEHVRGRAIAYRPRGVELPRRCPK